MALRESLCVDLSTETMAWLEATASACNSTPEDIVRLLVLTPIFLNSEDLDTGINLTLGDGASVSSSSKTRVLMREALGKIYEASARQEAHNTSIQNEVRSMFEMMNGESNESRVSEG